VAPGGGHCVGVRILTPAQAAVPQVPVGAVFAPVGTLYVLVVLVLDGGHARLKPAVPGGRNRAMAWIKPGRPAGVPPILDPPDGVAGGVRAWPRQVPGARSMMTQPDPRRRRITA
jgi:hypothetical protein